MGRSRTPVRSFSGLNTRAIEDGLTIAEFMNLQNFRLGKRGIRRRGGTVRLAVAADTITVMDLNGSDEAASCQLDTRVWSPKTKFTLRGIVNPDINTGVQPIVLGGMGDAGIEITTASSKLVANVQDTGSTVVAVTSTDDMPTDRFSFFLTRDGADLSLQIDNGTPDTGTMDADLSIKDGSGKLGFGTDGSNYFQGVIDSISLHHEVVASNADHYFHNADPYLDQSCMASYIFDENANGLAYDLSRFRNHAIVAGAPTAVASVANNQAPIRAITPFRSRSGERRLLVVAGTTSYIVEL